MNGKLKKEVALGLSNIINTNFCRNWRQSIEALQDSKTH